MRTRIVTVGVVALACVATLGLAAGSVGAPATGPGVTYDVTIPADALTLETGSGDAGAQQTATGAGSVAVPVGGGEVLFPVDALVLGLWLLVAFRKLNGAAFGAAAVAGGLGLAALYLVGLDGGGSAASVAGGSGPSRFVLVGAVVGVAVLAGAAALVVPRDMRRHDLPDGPPLAGLLGLLRRGDEGGDEERRSAAVDPDNDVYRAWLGMARAAGVEPAERTPRELVADAADAGLDREAAARLRRVFEAVRFGDADPTAARTERARDALDAARRPLGRADGERADPAPADGGDRQ